MEQSTQEGIKKAFAQLRKEGFLARMAVSGCCGGCISARLGQEVKHKVADGKIKSDESGNAVGLWFGRYQGVGHFDTHGEPIRKERGNETPAPVFVNHNGTYEQVRYFVEILNDQGVRATWNGGTYSSIEIVPYGYNEIYA